MNVRGWLILSIGIVVGLLLPRLFRERAEAQGPPNGNGNLAARVSMLELMVEGIVGDLDTAEQERDALKSDLETANQQIASLSNDLQTAQMEIDTLSSDLQTAGQAIGDLETKLASMSVVGNNVIFEGVNLVVRNGEGQTRSNNGTGNLIVGYDEGSSDDDKSGSHNLVVGPGHSYSSFGGLVAGEDNCISGESASVTGGLSNKATMFAATVVGGFCNKATGPTASVSGGYYNDAQAPASVVSGGAYHITDTEYEHKP